MLQIYKNLFQSLVKSELSYCVYKSLNQIETDLDGERGDIDILVNHSDLPRFIDLAALSGFKSFKVNDEHFYLFGIDSIEHKAVMIDLSSVIFAGYKPYKNFKLYLDVSKLDLDSSLIKKLNPSDYVPLMFLIRLMSKSERLEDLHELQDLLHQKDVSKLNYSYIWSLADKFLPPIDEVNKNILNAKSWSSLKDKYYGNAKRIYKIDLKNYLKSKILIVFKALRKIKHLIGIPQYRLQKGRLIAFIGVDGSGKSSAVDYIQNLKYFQDTGIKRIYFGSNEYWIPGLNYLLSISSKLPGIFRILVSALSLVDRQLRAVYAMYFILLGNTVLADRYTFDEYINREMHKQSDNSTNVLQKIYRKIFRLKMWIKPDIVIFMDVSPEVAYSRKQDYPYAQMLIVNEAYKNYMYKVPDVKIVNSNNSHDSVLHEVVDILSSNET